MPSSISQAALFVLLACPGLSWLLVRERRRPRWARSVVRETAELITISAIADVVGLAFSLWVLGATTALNERRLLAGTIAYYQTEPFLTLAWLAIGLPVAVLLAALAAYATIRSPSAIPGRRSNLPVWYFVLSREKHRDRSDRHGIGNIGKEPGMLVVCELVDGTQLGGLCFGYDDEPGHEGKRDLLLRLPTVQYSNDPSTPERTNPVNLVNYNNVVVNEQQIAWWTSKWLDPNAVTKYVAAVLAQRDRLRTSRSRDDV